MTELFLQTGQFYFGSGHTRVRTLLGTCVAIVIWHPRLRLGGMCHYLLPKRHSMERGTLQEPGMFADDVMQMFAQELKLTNTKPQDYIVKLFGGGRMFADDRRGHCPLDPCTDDEQSACHEVGCKNVKAGRKLLTEHGFNIDVEHVGGLGSRHLVFDVWAGEVWLKHSPQVVAVRSQR